MIFKKKNRKLVCGRTKNPESPWYGTYEATEWTLSQEPYLDGNYYFYPYMTSPGNDIGKISKDFAKECDTDDTCLGFNSRGWLKHTIKDERHWIRWTDDPKKGLYVKKVD